MTDSPFNRPKIGLVLGAGGVLGGAWMVGRAARARDRDRLGSGQRRPHRGHVGGLDDRGAVGQRCASLVHDRPLGRRGDRPRRRRWASGERRRSWRRRLPPAPRRAGSRAGVVEARARVAGAAVSLFAGRTARRLDSPGHRLVRALEGHRAARRRRRLDAAPEPVDHLLRLRGRAGSSRSDARARRAASLADAVAASCAVPGFYRPVRIGGRRYIDGGVHSLSNLDMLADLGLDLVICLNPTSSLHTPRHQTLVDRAAGPAAPAVGTRARTRGRAGTRIGHRGGPDPTDRPRSRRDGIEPDERSVVATS